MPLTTPTGFVAQEKGDKVGIRYHHLLIVPQEGLLMLYLAFNDLEAAIELLPSIFIPGGKKDFLPYHLFDQFAVQLGNSDKLMEKFNTMQKEMNY